MAALLELACRKNQAAELYEETFEEVALGFQSNRLKSVDTSTGAGIGLRVIRNGHIGFASSSQGDNEKFLLDSAVAAAEYGQVCHSEFPHSAPATQVECFDPEIPNVSTDQMAEEGTRAIEQLVREVQGFQCEAEIARTIITTHISNSRGLDVSYRKTVYSFGVYAFLGREGDFLGVGDSLSACNYNQWADYIATRIIERIKLSQKKATIETGSYPAIFTPRAIPVILGPIRRGINGKMVQKDISPLSSRLNEQIMDSSLTMTDSGILPYGRATSPVDGEGVPSRATPIIEKGVLRNFVLDTQTAALLGKESTANAIRDYDSVPSPGTTNLLLSPGNTSYEDMLADIGTGIVIDQVIGAGQSNILMGEFSVNLDLGFKVENGKVTGRLKNVMATGNAYDLLRSIRAIGNRQEQAGTTYAPHLYLAKVNIAS